jgi:predicted nuclease of predicted toxin-antitoxin system
LAEIQDRELWRLATAQKMVLISKDEDFFHLANQPDSRAQLVWVRLGNCRKQELLDAMGSAWPRIEFCLGAGDRVVEVR